MSLSIFAEPFDSDDSRTLLETGIHQHAAIALCRGAGFNPVGCWGEYASSPSSVCFEKGLWATTDP